MKLSRVLRCNLPHARWPAIFLLAAASPAWATDAAFDSTAALARARELRPFVSSGTPGPLWTSFAPQMRAAMGDSLRFAGVVASIHAQLGAITEVIDENVSRQMGWLYRARCRFERSPSPLVLIIGFDDDGLVSGMLVQPEKQPYASTKLDYVAKTALALPFRGDWFVFWGGRDIDNNYHAVSKSQRFAYDLLMMKDGSSHTGTGSVLSDYYCYGAEVLAPAAGTVAWSCDSLPDQVPGQMDPKNPVGNGVVIDHGNGEFSLLAHMQPKSLRVKTGDKVEASAVLGLCGNSGNTSEPHIHYHLQDGPDIKTAEGLPAPFSNLIVNGKPVAKAELMKGQVVSRNK
ncbi:MAG TPA: M23 family metallopeptidase [Candidatus Krumholzibacteria bacterium]|nr:M23 family metallopeptidase [Candidatus Krumholzibacteria bacterium]